MRAFDLDEFDITSDYLELRTKAADIDGDYGVIILARLSVEKNSNY
jgi:hypothetical protein